MVQSSSPRLIRPWALGTVPVIAINWRARLTARVGILTMEDVVADARSGGGRGEQPG